MKFLYYKYSVNIKIFKYNTNNYKNYKNTLKKCEINKLSNGEFSVEMTI